MSYLSAIPTRYWAIIAMVIMIVLFQGCATTTRPNNNSYYNTHVVQPGEDIFSIARYYCISPAALARANNISYEQIYPGLTLQTPTYGGECNISTWSPPEERYYTKQLPKKRSTKSKYTTGSSRGGTYHTVRRGENLYRIAKRYGQSQKTIAAWNNLSPPYTLSVGQKLRVKKSSKWKPSKWNPPATKPNVPPAATNTTTSHIVRRGDTLSKLARRYGYSVNEMARWNGLQYPYYLKSGRRLRVAPYNKKQWRIARNTRSGSQRGNYHIVSRGDTLYSIAKHYGQNSVAKIAGWNKLRRPYTLSVGQRLRVSASGSSSSRRQTGRTARHNSGYHRVARGDTLYSIARNYGYSVSDLAGWNNLYPPYQLSAGRELRVYPPSGARRSIRSSAKQRYTTSASSRSGYHTVRRGQTLYSIARRYGSTVDQLMHWNDLNNPSALRVGQRLRVRF